MLTRNRTDRGASAVEYGLLVAGVVAFLFLVLPALGNTLKTVFENENERIGVSVSP